MIWILVFITSAYAAMITWQYGEMDNRWIFVCHTLGMSSRTTRAKVYDRLITVVGQSRIFDEFVNEQIDNDFEEVDYEDDVETNSSVRK